MSYVTQLRLDRSRGDYPFPGRRYAQQPLLGLGAINVGQVLDAATQLTTNPDAYLRTKGPAIVAAADTYIVGPLTTTMAVKAAKYVVPPIIILYALSGLAAFFAYKAAHKAGAL